MGWSAADDEQRIGRIRGRYDGLAEAIKIVAEISGPMKPGDFNEQTWKMLCTIQSKLNYAAAEAVEIWQKAARLHSP